jgi:hypothetical protein
MQFQVSGSASAAYNLAALQTALPVAFAASQPAPIVPEMTYPVPYKAASDTYSRIQDNSLTFTPASAAKPITVQMQPKAIQELFELNYGRMNATLGVELPLTNFLTQTTIPLGYIDPPTDTTSDGGTQLWKITHNGVDTHAIHFHMFNVQLINRVGWDGMGKTARRQRVGLERDRQDEPLGRCYCCVKSEASYGPFCGSQQHSPSESNVAVGLHNGFLWRRSSGEPSYGC